MATKMSDPRELFLHELGDILFAEKTIVKMLPKLSKEASDRELKKGFDRHLKETQQHVKNLESVFKSLRKRVAATRCPGIEGLKAEHDAFVKSESPEPAILNAFLTGAATRTEHYEIAAYTGLLTMARALGEKEAVRLLDANLKQEKQMLKDAEAIGKRLAQDGAKKAAAAADGSSSRRAPARRASSTRGSTTTRRKPATRRKTQTRRA